MNSGLRRVVTGHDKNGRAIVEIDEISTNAISRRPGQTGTVMWTTQALPTDNTAKEDAALAKVDTTIEGGTVFRVVRYDPGVAPRVHRTDSVDYAVVVSGEIDMELDDGVSVHLRAGDIVVQRGTVHNWVNNGTVPCVVAFTLVSAHPLGLPPV
jgi:mannose-6-phosphate isomerase-like protein (cupin superfamily)